VEIAAGIVCGPVFQGGVSVARTLIRPAIEHTSQVAIMGASLAAGVATGAVVYTIKAIRRERDEIVQDFPTAIENAQEECQESEKNDTGTAFEADNQPELKEE
jgi:hypothetical protein